MTVSAANRVNQEALQNMIQYAVGDLSAAIGGEQALSNLINQYTYKERLYHQIMLEARLALYNWEIAKGALLVKAGKLGGTLNIGAGFPVSFPFSKSADITDWSITGGMPIPSYKYTDASHDIWGPRTYSTSTDGQKSRSFRNLILFPSFADSIRIGVQGHKKYPSTVWNVSIGVVDFPFIPPSLNIVTGSQEFFTFDGENRIQLKPDPTMSSTVYSDWLDYSVVDFPLGGVQYYISMYCEESFSGFTGTGGTGCWYIDGDVSLEQDWGSFSSAVSGSAGQHPRCLSVVQGTDSTLDVGWDSDSRIEKWILAYNSMKQMVYSKPYGTVAMLKILNKALPTVASKVPLIQNRNDSLGEFVK